MYRVALETVMSQVRHCTTATGHWWLAGDQPWRASAARRQQSNGTRHHLLGDDVTEPLVGEHCNNLSEQL